MIRLPFITRLKRLFRPKRPTTADYQLGAAVGLSSEKVDELIAESGAESFVRFARLVLRCQQLAGAGRPVHAPDAVLASEVRGWIAESNAEALEATRSLALADNAVTGKISPITQRKLTVTLTDSGHVARVILEGDGKPELDIDCGERHSIATGDHRGETFAEIIRIADALYRLCGVKK